VKPYLRSQSRRLPVLVGSASKRSEYYGSRQRTVSWRLSKDALEQVITLALGIFLQQESCLPCAKDLLYHRQTRYAVRVLTADEDHPTHQLLPASFRLGELYRHEGATGQPSSTGWTRQGSNIEDTHIASSRQTSKWCQTSSECPSRFHNIL
jgi:hypothetical protein